MISNKETPLFVCYISGLDVRRLTPSNTPYIAYLLESCPHSNYTNLPSNELFPTLVTGANPAVHGVWGVQYEKNKRSSVVSRIVDVLPDTLTTGFQCFRHFLDNSFDLAGVPPHRRRNFKLTRTKYKRRSKHPGALFDIGGVPTVMKLAGKDRSRYSFSSNLNPVKTVLPSLCENGDLQVTHRIMVHRIPEVTRYFLDGSSNNGCPNKWFIEYLKPHVVGF